MSIEEGINLGTVERELPRDLENDTRFGDRWKFLSRSSPSWLGMFVTFEVAHSCQSDDDEDRVGREVRAFYGVVLHHFSHTSNCSRLTDPLWQHLGAPPASPARLPPLASTASYPN